MPQIDKDDFTDAVMASDEDFEAKAHVCGLYVHVQKESIFRGSQVRAEGRRFNPLDWVLMMVVPG